MFSSHPGDGVQPYSAAYLAGAEDVLIDEIEASVEASEATLVAEGDHVSRALLPQQALTLNTIGDLLGSREATLLALAEGETAGLGSAASTFDTSQPPVIETPQSAIERAAASFAQAITNPEAQVPPQKPVIEPLPALGTIAASQEQMELARQLNPAAAGGPYWGGEPVWPRDKRKRSASGRQEREEQHEDESEQSRKRHEAWLEVQETTLGEAPNDSRG